jgi:hypothetical protein
MKKSTVALTLLGVVIVLAMVLAYVIQWAMKVEYIQSPIVISTQKMIIYRSEVKEYKHNLMKQKANEGIRFIDEFWQEYPDMRPTEVVTPSPTPKVQGKGEKIKISGTVESFPKFLTDEGFDNRQKALEWLSQKYSENEVVAFDNILKKESGYRTTALNEIGAGGICQAYPHTKMPCELSPEALMCQLEWCDTYIANRYGSPLKAWEFHITNNWF